MADISERTADWLGVRYLKKLMNEEELASWFEDATWHCEHHNYDLNYIGKFAWSELPRETGYKVVLTGEGADEHFAGYPTYLPDFLREPDHSRKYITLSDAEREILHTEKEAEVADYHASMGAEFSKRAHSACSRMLNNISTPESMRFPTRLLYESSKQLFLQELVDNNRRIDPRSRTIQHDEQVAPPPRGSVYLEQGPLDQQLPVLFRRQNRNGAQH